MGIYWTVSEVPLMIDITLSSLHMLFVALTRVQRGYVSGNMNHENERQKAEKPLDNVVHCRHIDLSGQ